MRVAASESVRATARRSVLVSAHDISLRADGNQTVDVLADRHKHFPAMCPHFFVPGAWSSIWIPAAPFSMKSLVSFITAVKPPCPVSASAMIGRR